jgi:hypothetical protein
MTAETHASRLTKLKERCTQRVAARSNAALHIRHRRPLLPRMLPAPLNDGSHRVCEDAAGAVLEAVQLRELCVVESGLRTAVAHYGGQDVERSALVVEEAPLVQQLIPGKRREEAGCHEGWDGAGRGGWGAGPVPELVQAHAKRVHVGRKGVLAKGDLRGTVRTSEAASNQQPPTQPQQSTQPQEALHTNCRGFECCI